MVTVARVPEPRPASLTRADIASEVERVVGRRVVLVNETETVRSYRAWAPPTTRRRGFGEEAREFVYLPVVTEREWWAHEINGDEPDVLLWPLGAAWVEDDLETSDPPSARGLAT